jgi:NADPH-dependent 2,4-dienoyl-CoA reductase/sulfur reductase-like enzyme
MSEFFERYYVSRGVQLLKGESVARLEGKDQVSAAVLSSGRKISCDLVVAGIGATPVSALFTNSGLTVENGVVVNEYLETKLPGIFAAGDVANYLDIIFDKRRRVEHWDNAVSQDSTGQVSFVVTGSRFHMSLTSSPTCSISRMSCGVIQRGQLRRSLAET